MKIFITGVAGFIGFHTVKKLVNLGFTVVGIDNINDYYDTKPLLVDHLSMLTSSLC